jgi:hemolysin D
VQLDAFNYIKYGAIDGVVENIYQDSVEDEKMGYVFLATINLKDNKIQYKGKTTRLHAGLSVVVRIKTGRRRVIDYLLSNGNFLYKARYWCIKTHSLLLVLIFF